MTLLMGDVAAPGCLADAVASVAPEIVIHCAAMVNVEACEQDPAQAYACNAQATKGLVRAVSPKCLVVYISTDSVFKGEKPFATEEELPSPRSVYARSKLQGEWEVEQGTERHLIVRTNFYGWSSGRKETSAEWLYRALETSQPVTLFHDMFFTPMYVVDFVERLMRLIEQGHRGRFHLAGGERVSKYQFGALMASVAQASMDHVRVGSIDEAALGASRPKDMSLGCERFQRLTGMQLPGCQEGLRRFLNDRSRPLSARVSVGQAHVTSQLDA
jgi:dTDP-4-dehydrorhamnose reductase